MLDHDQVIPEERQEQNQSLIEDLSGYYDTRDEDRASLARIRARLLKNTATPLPVADGRGIAQFPLTLPPRREMNTRRNVVRRFAKDGTRRPFLNSVAAAVLLAVLVSSFLVLLNLRQGTPGGSRPPTIAHGWSVAATFHGTGKQTITGQNIEVGHRFGWLLTCTNTSNGLGSITFHGPAQALSGNACSGSTKKPLGPAVNATSPVAFPPIRAIEVTVAASTSWELTIFKGTYYPPLSTDAAHWHALHDEMDGTGSQTWLGDIRLPKMWAMQYVCHGTGPFTLRLQSDTLSPVSDPSTVTEACDGQTYFDTSETTGETLIVHQIQITTGAENDWQVVLYGCVNGQPHCGITTATSTPTP